MFFTLAGIMGLGMQELLVILLIIVVLFGATKLPQIGRGLGEAIRNFKQGTRGEDGPAEITEGQRTGEEHPRA